MVPLIPTLVASLVITGVAFGVATAWWIRRRSADDELQQIELKNMTIDLNALPVPANPHPAHHLDVYSVPCRLVVLVLAPLGARHSLPPKEEWRAMLEQLTPGFSRILDEHQPTFRQWPGQVSHHGFVHAFFSNMRAQELSAHPPHWYKLAGRLEWSGHTVLVGLVTKTDYASPLHPVEVEQPGKWLEILRVVHA